MTGKHIILSIIGLSCIMLIAGCTVITKLEKDEFYERYYGKNKVSLAHLVVSPGTLTPKFSPIITEYKLNVDRNVNTITCNMEAMDNNVEVYCNKKLIENNIASLNIAYGYQTFTIRVILPEKLTKDYTLTVYRNDTPGIKVSKVGKNYRDPTIHIPENSTLDLGDLMKDSSTDIDFRITNTGFNKLVIQDVTTPISINHNDVSLTKYPTIVLPENSKSYFTLTVTPTTIGQNTATISIPSNAPDNPVYTFNIAWTTQYWEYRADTRYSHAYAIACDSTNNIYTAGYGEDLINYHSAYDWWIKKFDIDGNEDTINWNKMIDGVNNRDSAYTLTIDNEDNIYVAGYGNRLVTDLTSSDWWIKKFDIDGNEDIIHWNKIDDGSNDNNYITALATDSLNNLYVIGEQRTYDTGKSLTSSWIKKFDAYGNEALAGWNKVFNQDIQTDTNLTCITVDHNDNIYIAGYYNYPYDSTTDTDSGYIKKFSPAGIEDTLNWNKEIPYLFLTSLVIDSDNNVFVAGRAGNTIIIKQFDTNGLENTDNWNKTITAPTYNYKEIKTVSLACDSSQNLYLTAGSYELVSSDSSLDIMIKKFDRNGNEDRENWNKVINLFGYSSNDKASSITIDANDNVYICGSLDDKYWVRKFDKDGN